MRRISSTLIAAAAALGLACLKGPIGDTGPAGPPGAQGPAGVFAGAFAGGSTIAGNLGVQGQVSLPAGDGPNTAATSCAALLSARPGLPSGAYWLKPSTAAAPFRAYCDMTNEGGGWTLVWSNLRGYRGKPFTELQFKTAIDTLPRASDAVSNDLESFMVYTGLKHWTALAPGGLLRYDWAPDYGAAVQQRYQCPFAFTDLNTYQITFNTASCTQPVGTVAPGLMALQNNSRFTTYDVDNDGYSGNCAALYTSAPWWYSNCWDGSLVGGGELNGQGYFNGAYWRGTASAWGGAGGSGAGNGWLYVK